MSGLGHELGVRTVVCDPTKADGVRLPAYSSERKGLADAELCGLVSDMVSSPGKVTFEISDSFDAAHIGGRTIQLPRVDDLARFRLRLEKNAPIAKGESLDVVSEISEFTVRHELAHLEQPHVDKKNVEPFMEAHAEMVAKFSYLRARYKKSNGEISPASNRGLEYFAAIRSHEVKAAFVSTVIGGIHWWHLPHFFADRIAPERKPDPSWLDYGRGLVAGLIYTFLPNENLFNDSSHAFALMGHLWSSGISRRRIENASNQEIHAIAREGTTWISNQLTNQCEKPDVPCYNASQ